MSAPTRRLSRKPVASPPPPLDTSDAYSPSAAAAASPPHTSPLMSPTSPNSRARYQNTQSPVQIHSPRIQVQEPSAAVLESAGAASPVEGSMAAQTLPYQGTHVRNVSAPILEDFDPVERAMADHRIASPHTASPRTDSPNNLNGFNFGLTGAQEPVQLQYHHEKVEQDQKTRQAQRASHGTIASSSSDSQTVSSAGDHSNTSASAHNPRASIPRARFSPVAEAHSRGRSLTPQGLRSESPRPLSAYGRNLSAVSANNRVSDLRPVSMVDLLKIPYSQQMAHQLHSQDNAKLQGNVGSNASLLNTQKTLDMYRANVKKTNDNSVQYEFALFMVNAAQEIAPASRDPSPNPASETKGGDRRRELLKEAKTILRSLSDRGYPYAQYYLGDGYASGLFSHGKPDQASAFGLFVAAGKHGHAEASYRTALCYEFGWGCRRDLAKAVQYLRQAASKGHPGAAVRLGKACLTGDMGQQGKLREGTTWLKRATENADRQYNNGPYELGLLHIKGFGADVFKDEGYAAQLFTKAADLGHAEANMRMGEVYEHGLLTCPKDPVLSIHFYNNAAEAGFPEAMMALCAWYMVGAEPVLKSDKNEAFAWAKRAAELELPKAEYTVGYFTEMGVGCRRDPLEANVWYTRAADHGDERAQSRLRVIREAETGTPDASNGKAGKTVKKKGDKDDKECIVM